MKAIHDPGNVLEAGLADISTAFQLPRSFPADVLNEATEALKRSPEAHADWTDRRFVTLDPASSRDLDQAFCIERSNTDLILHYAIADVGWFVRPGSRMDAEAWSRGMSLYLPGARVPLYPPALSEQAASLLPDGPRPAIVHSVRIDSEGEVELLATNRAIVRSRAKLAYDKVRPDELPEGFAELGQRIAEAERRRGAARIDPPEQELVALPAGGFALSFRPRLESEANNAALSLAANLAMAKCMLAHETGIFRIMPEPDAEAIRQLRLTAAAFGVDWLGDQSLVEMERRLDPARPGDAAFALAIRRAGERAAYAPFASGEKPWHAAIAAPYAHGTAPLRRLADRYVNEAILALANGQSVPPDISSAFARLPSVMAKAEAKAGQVERAAIDLAESVVLSGQVGQVFEAIILDVGEKRTRIQLCDVPVIANLPVAASKPGDRVRLRLLRVSPEDRKVQFDLA